MNMMKEKLKWINETHNNQKFLILIGLIKTLSQMLNIVFFAVVIFFIMGIINEVDLEHREYVFLVICLLFSKGILVYLEGYFQGKVSGRIKVLLKDKIFLHVKALGPNKQHLVDKSLLTQLSTEGVEQLDLYFTLFIPQMIYGTLAPIIVLVILSFINIYVTIILFTAIPLIPLIIIAINKKAKKKLGKYWNSYGELGHIFFDFLQGINTIKVFNADDVFNRELNEKAETFRQSTMKVLKMQLNSITIMDIVAFGGAALAIIALGINAFKSDANITLLLFGVILSADFFIPLRSLGSAFHVATNGIAAFDKMKDFLYTEPMSKKEDVVTNFEYFRFCFNHASLEVNEKKILQDINMEIEPNKLTVIVGESGSGKTTCAKLMTGEYFSTRGSVNINGFKINIFDEVSLSQKIIYVNVEEFLPSGTVKSILSHGFYSVSELDIWEALERVNLKSFFASKLEGLDFFIESNGRNISGGQKERLMIAKAILLDAPVYIFDEPTSSVDYENEKKIIELIHQLAKEKTVVCITHKLLSITNADIIYVIDDGQVIGQGNHSYLMNNLDVYKHLYDEQRDLNDWREL
jgi:ABC-type transport system involved in cytochrome bd biosynthesis fused ATPase/permease subunit